MTPRTVGHPIPERSPRGSAPLSRPACCELFSTSLSNSAAGIGSQGGELNGTGVSTHGTVKKDAAGVGALPITPATCFRAGDALLGNGLCHGGLDRRLFRRQAIRRLDIRLRSHRLLIRKRFASPPVVLARASVPAGPQALRREWFAPTLAFPPRHPPATRTSSYPLSAGNSGISILPGGIVKLLHENHRRGALPRLTWLGAPSISGLCTSSIRARSP